MLIALKKWWPLIGAALFALVAYGWLSSCQQQRVAGTQAKLDSKQAGATIASARDATETVSAAATRDAAIDDLTRDNEHAIRTAPGADAPVDPHLRDVALERLCRRPSYQADPACVQLRAAGQLAGGNSASAAARR